jgi:hypothetical protein
VPKKLPPEVAEFFKKEGERKAKRKLPPSVTEYFRETGAEVGRARAKLMDPERRAQIAKAAAAARWSKKP